MGRVTGTREYGAERPVLYFLKITLWPGARGMVAAGLPCSASVQAWLRTKELTQAGHRVTVALSHLSEQIEEGGKADSVSSGLQAGDEVIHINEVALSSSRREAVSLVKGSYKTLRLVVRR
jgi:hypothetical protein